MAKVLADEAEVLSGGRTEERKKMTADDTL